MTVAPLAIAYNFLHDEPRSAARLLETKDRQAVVQFLEQAPVQDVAATLLEMQADVAGPVLSELNQKRMAEVVSLLSAHQLSGMIRTVDEPAQTQVLATLPEWRRLSCKTLLRFDADMVGVLAQTNVPVLSGDLLVEECLARIRKQPFKHNNLVYVVDQDRKLLGSISPAALLTESPRRAVSSLTLNDIPQIRGRTPLVAAIHHASWNRADTLAVIDSRKAFVGVVDHHSLRAALTSPSTRPTQQLPVNELLGAFSASLMGLLELFEVELKPSEHQ